MVAEKFENMEQALERAKSLLLSAEISQANFDAKKLNFVKVFKHMDSSHRHLLCAESIMFLLEKHRSNQRTDGLLYLLTCGFAAERDWDSTLSFLQKVVEASSDAEFFKELAIIWLEICDLELDDRVSRLPVAHTALVLLTEFGLLLANRAGKSAMDNNASGRVVEFITTSLLARSNINSMAMRISLLHYLFKNPMNQHASQQLHRVIGRFGQTVLEEVLTSLFENKKRETAAFYFLLEHLNLFVSGAPSLVEMSHSVLRHYMLKYPDEFPKFLSSYAEKVAHNAEKVLPLTKHMSLLLRVATEFSQRSLTDSLSTILTRQLHTLKSNYGSEFTPHAEMALTILDIEAFQRAPKSILIGDCIQSIKTLLLTEKDNSKVVLLNKFKRVKEVQIKQVKLGEEPTPLESLLLLAS